MTAAIGTRGAGAVLTPYRIVTPRLELRCWQPGDAKTLVEVVEANRGHLLTWMPWAQKHEGTEQYIEKIRGWRAMFDTGRDFSFGIFDRADTGLAGGIGWHARIGAGAREIGYWIVADRTRRGYASEAAGALTRIGFEHLGLRRMEIHCHPDNIASAGVPRRLGYAHHVTIARCARDAAIEPRDTSIYAMTLAGYQASAASNVQIRMFDAAGLETSPRS